jgi:hypothetical protein
MADAADSKFIRPIWQQRAPTTRQARKALSRTRVVMASPAKWALALSEQARAACVH